MRASRAPKSCSTSQAAWHRRGCATVGRTILSALSLIARVCLPDPSKCESRPSTAPSHAPRVALTAAYWLARHSPNWQLLSRDATASPSDDIDSARRFRRRFGGARGDLRRIAGGGRSSGFQDRSEYLRSVRGAPRQRHLWGNLGWQGF